MPRPILLPGGDTRRDADHSPSMSRFAAAAGAFVFTVASAPVAHATVVKTSPATGAIVSNAAPITLAWSTDNLTSPAFGGQVNIVITRKGRSSGIS